MIGILVVLLLAIATASAAESDYIPPEPIFEALKSGELRVYIPADPGTNLFAINANVNSFIEKSDPGTISTETITKTDNFWVIKVNHPLNVGDSLHYWIHININNQGVKKLGFWRVSELKDSYAPLLKTVCTKASTLVNGESTCVGSIIFEDSFDGTKIDRTEWTVEHRIPTYSGPNFEFNSYLNDDATRFIKKGIMHLKPVALQHENEVRGLLNLTKDCTSDDPDECCFQQLSSFLLPPVKSAKITSKISFKYGKVSIRAKLPFGDWIYPILELEQKTKIDGENSAKIWIAYSRGNDYLIGEKSNEDLGSRILFGGPILKCAEPERSEFLRSHRENNSFSSDFREYTVQWTPDKMIFYIDSLEYGSVNVTRMITDPPIDMRSRHAAIPQNPFDREYVISLGVAVGGIGDFPDGYYSKKDPKPWLNGERNYIKNFFDARNVWAKTWIGDNPALQIDYVKVWAV